MRPYVTPGAFPGRFGVISRVLGAKAAVAGNNERLTFFNSAEFANLADIVQPGIDHRAPGIDDILGLTGGNVAE